MAGVAVARPLPTVLQPADIRYPRRSRVASYSSTSESAPSSNPHSGESWFQVSASQSSHSSTSSVPPLPKGARPASPQPSRFFDLDVHSLASNLHKSTSPLKRSGTFSSWKLEWRGISKVVKWAVLGDKSGDNEPKLHNSTSRRNKNTRVGNSTKSQREPVSQQSDEALPGRAFSPYICASPSSPLSPMTSATQDELIYEGQYSVSELGDGHGQRLPASEVRFPSQGPPSIPDELLRRHRGAQASRHGTHVREWKNTNVRRAASEYDHGHPYPRHDMKDTFLNADRSTTSLDSTHDWSGPPRAVHSDIGHSSSVGYMPSALPSTLSLSYGHDHSYVKSGTKVRAFKNFQSMQSAVVLSVSSSNTGSPLNHHRRPRKLRKSLRAMPAHELRPSHPRLNHPPTSMQPGLAGRIASKAFTSEVLLAPPVPTKSHPKPPRKLKKKPSPALPPIPRSNSSRDTSGDAPPVPPKPALPFQRQRESVYTSVPNYHISGTSTESPASTGSSRSSSGNDEFHLGQDSSATSENLDEEVNANPPVKRPSLLRTESNRRWTVAVADVPDDLFIEELERLRRMGLRAGDVHGFYDVAQTRRSVPTTLGVKKARDVSADCNSKHISEEGRTKTANAVLIQQVDTEDETEWLHARHTILCCRELVRTERSYQERLQELADGNVSDAVPALLIQYLPALIGASKILSARFNEDMSAFGVSNALLSVLPTLERALVPWCGVVGEFFTGDSSTTNVARRKRDTTIPGFVTEEEMHTEFGAVKVRCMSMQVQSNAYMSRSSSTRLLIPEAMSTSSSSHWLFRPAFAQGSSEPSNTKEASMLRKSLRRTGPKDENERRRKPPFRDLAILPTQRVTRYVLLYKDLLKHTPVSSPTCSLVEKAVESAVRLAQKCDRAQNNSTFLYHN